MTRARRLGPLDRVGVVLVVTWWGWVIVSTVLNGRALSFASPYLYVPLVAVAGVATGRVFAPRAHRWQVAGALLALGLYLITAWLVTPGPGKLPLHYANANAALGVQLIAVAGLAALSIRRTTPPEGSAEAPLDPGVRWVAVLAVLAVLAAVGVVVVNWSQAGNVVAIPVVLATAWAWLRGSGPWRPLMFAAGALAVAAAGAAGLWLAVRSTWPTPVLRALDPARKQLWGDAVAVWRAHPLTGGGPGSFAESSLLARDPDTSTVHSSLLQVGSELGLIGVGLFGVLLLLGLAVATRGSRASALIAASAWSALLIHSFVDHLFEFAAVTFAAGVVLGWASAPASAESAPYHAPSPAPSRSRSRGV